MLLKKIEPTYNPNGELESVITSLLALVDDNPLRDGLRDTPAARVAKGWRADMLWRLLG